MKPTTLIRPLVFATAVLATSWIPRSTWAGPDPPLPPEVDLPCGINLVGMANGIADPIGEFSVIVRDFAMNPMPNVHVDIVLNECTDFRLGVFQPFPGVVADCANGPVGTVQAVTNLAGIASFRIVGGARNLTGHDPGAGFQCASVYTDGVFVGRVNVGAFDENSVGGVNPADISVWLQDYFSGVYVGRSDFDCSHTLSPVDLSRLLSVSLSGVSGASAAAYCN